MQEKAVTCAMACFTFDRVSLGRKPLPILILSSVRHARLYSWQMSGDSFLILMRARVVCEECYHTGIEQKLVTGCWSLVSANASAVASSKGASPFHSSVVTHQSGSLLFVFQSLSPCPVAVKPGAQHSWFSFL